MVHRVDARGLACPQPVIKASRALESNDSIIVKVDNQTAYENIQRLAKSKGCSVAVEKKSDGIYIFLEKQVTQVSLKDQVHGTVIPGAVREERVLLISQDVMGRGDDSLGAILMKGFFHTLAETDPSPDTIIACGTCLDYFNLKQSLRAGTVSNMYEIKELMLASSSKITL